MVLFVVLLACCFVQMHGEYLQSDLSQDDLSKIKHVKCEIDHGDIRVSE